MTWLQRYRVDGFLRNSVWLPPLIGMVAALLVHALGRHVDAALGLNAIVGVDGARAVLAALASSMLTFIVFVFSVLLLAVQLASAQLTPRIIATFFRNRVLKFSLTIFVFAFTYTLGVLLRIEASVPQISFLTAVYSSLASIGVFLYLIDNVGKSLRPVSLLTQIGNTGQVVIEDVYPKLVAGTADGPTNVALVPGGEPSRTAAATRTGVVLALDVTGLADLARRADSEPPRCRWNSSFSAVACSSISAIPKTVFVPPPAMRWALAGRLDRMGPRGGGECSAGEDVLFVPPSVNARMRQIASIHARH